MKAVTMIRLYGELSLFASRSQMEEHAPVRPVLANGRWRLASRVQHGRLWLRLNYHERVYRRETIEKVVAGMLRALQTLAAKYESKQSLAKCQPITGVQPWIKAPLTSGSTSLRKGRGDR